jgi:D-tyrosyl-tRNA(Tyr) deacylase
MRGWLVIALLQRVLEARVSVAGEPIAAIGTGILALIAVEKADGADEVERLAERLLRFRLFPDSRGRMDLDVRAAGGALLLVPQFTLAADTSSGNRPSFSGAAPPDTASALFDRLVETIANSGQQVATGRFGADMQVALVNDGPVTFMLRVPGAA